MAGFPDLPLEIIANIFSRLPIQDLFHYRLVSKAWHRNWNHLISDPDLIKSHHSRGNHHRAQFLVLSCSRTPRGSKLYTASDIAGNCTSPWNLEQIPLNIPVGEIEIVGSSHGLICLALLPHYNLFYICNPVTRECLKLPKARRLNAGGHKMVESIRCGFAFDAASYTYKVIYPMYVPGDSDTHRTEIQIYAVGSCTRAWRARETLYGCNDIVEFADKPMVLLNGALHWLTVKDDRTSVGVIDVGSESFKELETPIGCTPLVRNLTVLDECLCICASDYGAATHIWVMTDYGDVKSWTLMYCFLARALWPLCNPFDCVKVVGRMGKETCLILSCGQYQGYCDFERIEHREIVVDDGLRDLCPIDAVLHTGSLVSPVSVANRYMKKKMFSMRRL